MLSVEHSGLLDKSKDPSCKKLKILDYTRTVFGYTWCCDLSNYSLPQIIMIIQCEIRYQYTHV
jgi:hypothetical protein